MFTAIPLSAAVENIETTGSTAIDRWGQRSVFRYDVFGGLGSTMLVL